MRSRINAARNLANDIARIGAQHGQQVSVSAPHGYNGISRESMNGVAVSHGGAVPVSAPEPSMGVPLRIIVTNQMAKEDLCKSSLVWARPELTNLSQQEGWTS